MDDQSHSPRGLPAGGPIPVHKLRPAFDVDFARACLDCGALLSFLGDVDLQRHNEDAAEGLTGYDI
ncbi:hypothetical protein [Streptomyces sp. NPDC059850]|uniref:hypothetical protein n=1 Tax=Streptomyces sp. NPDC059850 TaxID=3346970 RepID=UPI0036477EA7